jgi:hypothetical protein
LLLCGITRPDQPRDFFSEVRHRAKLGDRNTEYCRASVATNKYL